MASQDGADHSADVTANQTAEQQAEEVGNSIEDSEIDACSECSDDSDNATSDDGGNLHDHFESAYLPGKNPARKKPAKDVLDYDNCSPEELKSFVVGRRLKDPVPTRVTLRSLYIICLDAADKNWTFRLADLPAEMRLAIYRHLLVYPNGNDDCCCREFPGQRTLYPAILRTCKWIHEEAKDIIYEENTFSATMKLEETPSMMTRDGRVHREHFAGACGHVKFSRLPLSINDYPIFFRKIKHLKISLSYYDLNDDADFPEYYGWPLNHFLLALSSFLMDGHCLQSLHLHLSMWIEADAVDLPGTLFPLLRLRNIPTFKMTFEDFGLGDKILRIEKKLRTRLRDVEPSYNTLRHWNTLCEEAMAQINLLNALHGEITCTCGECDMPECVDEIEFRLASLQALMPDAFVNAQREEKFIARLALLRDRIRKVDTKGLMKLLKDLLSKRAAVQEYEAVSDDGRMDEALAIWKGEGLRDDDEEYVENEWSDDDENEPKTKAADVLDDQHSNDEKGVNKKVAIASANQPLLDDAQIEAIFEEYGHRDEV